MEGISSRCRLDPDLVWWLLHPHPCKVLPWSCLDGQTDRQRAPSLTGTEGSHPVKFGRLINFITLTTLWVSALQFLVLLQSRALAALCCVPSRCRRCNKSLVCSLINTKLNVWKGKKKGKQQELCRILLQLLPVKCCMRYQPQILSPTEAAPYLNTEILQHHQNTYFPGLVFLCFSHLCAQLYLACTGITFNVSHFEFLLLKMRFSLSLGAWLSWAGLLHRDKVTDWSGCRALIPW